MRPAAALALGFALAGALGACASRPPVVSLAQGPRSYRHQDYDRVFERWSRGGEVLDFPDLARPFAADATYLSWDFRWAYAVRYAHDAGQGPDELAHTLVAAQQAAQRDHEFFVALTTLHYRWGEITRPTSAWQITLIDDRGHVLAPSRVEWVRRSYAADLTYFQYVTPWRQLYRIHFPLRATAPDGTEFDVLGPGTRYFILRFGGPQGSMELRWDVASAR